MMKNNIFIIIVWGIVILPCLAFSAPEKPKQDEIHILEEIIRELFEYGNQYDFLEVDPQRAQATYIKNYGLIIQTPIYQINHNRFQEVVKLLRNIGRTIEIPDGEANAWAYSPTLANQSGNYVDSLIDLRDHQVIDLINKFVVDYGDLAKSLQPNEKIYIFYDQQKQLFNQSVGKEWGFVFNVGEKQAKDDLAKITAEIRMEDINKFKEGKISQTALEEKIVFSTSESSRQNQVQFQILAKIFENTTEGDQERMPIHSYKTVDYQLLEGMGVIYYIDINGPLFLHGHVPRVYHIPNDEEIEVRLSKKQEELAKERNDATENSHGSSKTYENLLAGLKKNMVEYGRTLKDLHEDDVLVVEVSFEDCMSCQFPNKTLLSVDNSVLRAYDSRKISLGKAIEMVNMEEN